MNKTVNINLGGFFFHIDENAYQKLNRYFEAIKQSLDAAGRDEIMNDIESRISELFSEKLTSEKQVIGLLEVDQVIAIMGQPEDYRIEGEDLKSNTFTYESKEKTSSKKLFRDTENGILSGVSSGLSHYFGIDKVWIRIIFVLITLAGFGTGILAYIILWAVTPEAITTTDKLEMIGEPINISNIERKVREEFNLVTDKLKNADYGKMGNHVKSSAEKIGGSLGSVIGGMLNIVGKIIGAIIVFTASVTLIGLILSIFTLGSTSFVHAPWLDYFNTFNYNNTSMFFIGLLFLFAIGIPIFFMLYLGLKILVNNLKSIGSIAKYSLLGVWIIAVIALITLGVKQASEIAFENKTVQKRTLNLSANDTLLIKFKTNDYYSKDINHHEDFKFVQDSANQEFIYSNDIDFEILLSDEPYAYIQIEKKANGKSFKEAKNRAEKINYGFKIENNKLILDNYLLADAKSKYRGQEVSIYLYLPKGTIFKTDLSVQEFDDSDNDFFNLHYSSNDYVYKVENSQVKCLNCPPDENEYNDIDNQELEEELEEIVPGNVTINKNGITITNDTINSDSKNIKELKINKDGIIIKTN